MSDAKIPWFAEAAKRLQRYHVKIDAVMRRLAWGEEFTIEHETAFIEVICAANKIRADTLKHLSKERERRARLSRHIQHSP